MQATNPTAVRNLDGYGTPPIEWSRVRAALGADISQAPETGGPGRHTSWLTTTNPDGSPHIRPLGVVSVDGVWYFTSGAGTRKSKNISLDPRCAVSVATHPFDLVVEGTAERVVDPEELQAAADEFAKSWPVTVAGDSFTAEFSAPSAGPPPWDLYRVNPTRVFAFGTAEPYGATRFDLGADG